MLVAQERPRVKPMGTAYELRVRGHLDPPLTVWFPGLAMSLTEEGDTLLTGEVPDAAALHGLLARCHDLGLTLISLNPLPAPDTTARGSSDNME